MEKQIREACRASAFPGNPLPFLLAVYDHVRENGTASIQDDDCKAALLVVVQQCWGQMVTLDTVQEYGRLNKLDGKEESEANDDAVCHACGWKLP